MNVSLKGKTAVVCGSTQGIGWATAQELASLGAKVVLVARNEEKLRSNAASLDGSGHSHLAVDFTRPEELRTKINEWSRNNLAHILVNNTGGPPAGLASKAATGEFLDAFNQHLVCNHIMTTALIDGMKSLGYGRIVNVISTSVKQPLANLGVSNTIRGAVANWSKTLANELGQFNITVNNVLPGATATGRLDSIIANKASKTGKTVDEAAQGMTASIPLGRFAQPEELAQAIAFLCSPAASYISGINLPVDGGRTGCL